MAIIRSALPFKSFTIATNMIIQTVFTAYVCAVTVAYPFSKVMYVLFFFRHFDGIKDGSVCECDNQSSLVVESYVFYRHTD